MAANPEAMPFAPLQQEQARQLEHLTDSMDSHALYWLSGYAAGRARALDLVAGQAPAISQPATAAQPAISERITVLYGSQTGNGQALAENYAAELKHSGYNAVLISMADFKARQLKDEKYLVVVVSTHGDGDPPDDAIDFIEQLESKKAPQLEHLSFAVLALGDSSYPDFCSTGLAIDARLADLGGQRFAECAKADLDIEAVAEPWWQGLQTNLKTALQPQGGATVTPLHPLAADTPVTTSYTRNDPYAAELLTNQRITGSRTDKDVRHIEFDLGESGIRYEPGDALGVWPTNPTAIATNIIDTLELSADDTVDLSEGSTSLQDALINKRELTLLSRDFLSAHAQRITHNADRQQLEQLLADDNRRELSELFQSHQLVDALRRWPAVWDSQALVDTLRKLTPRMYSIASSQQVTDDEVHTTVARVAYQAHGYAHLGAASSFIADLDAEQAAAVPIFIDRNPRFRLPEDTDRDIIMIGPGTGIAPFRAFVQHRAAGGASGKNWLFFGAQHFHSQFLYQLEWQQALKNGSLERLDLAFSRDQAEKIYVQQRMLEQGKDLYAWLENGAYLYVCGDANHMAKDVDAALHQLIAEHGGKTADQAAQFVRDLTRQKRYLRDVY